MILARASARRHWLEGALGEELDTIAVESLHQARALLEGGGVRAVVVDVDELEAIPLLDGHRSMPLFVLGDARCDAALPKPARYLLSPELAPASVRQLLRRAIAAPSLGTEREVSSTRAATRAQKLLRAARHVARQTKLSEAARVARAGVAELCNADEARCLFFDAEEGLLWTDPGDPCPVELPAAQGLLGFAARTAVPLHVARLADDPRYLGPTDNPQGRDDDRMLVWPITRGGGEVDAVLVAIRRRAQPDFDAEDRSLLESFAHQVGLTLSQIELQRGIDARLHQERDHGPFRAEAFEDRTTMGRHGDVVRVMPRWIRGAYVLLLVVMIASLVGLALGQVDTYSSGPSMVRWRDRTELNPEVSADLLALHVEPGDRVAEGQLLATLDGDGLADECERLELEHARLLRNRMLDPTDAAVGVALTSAREALHAARRRLTDYEVRAPHEGVVSDIRTRAGQHVTAGAPLLTVVRPDAGLEVIALLPGGDGPQLEAGLPLRLELDGYAYAYQDLRVEEVSAEVIGPEEARRALGPQVAGTLQPSSPVVLVRATVPSASFEADGESFRYHDGMRGTSEVRLRSESVLTTLLPALGEL